MYACASENHRKKKITAGLISTKICRCVGRTQDQVMGVKKKKKKKLANAPEGSGCF